MAEAVVTVSKTTNRTPTILDLVNRIRRECRLEEEVSLVPGNNRTKVALDGISDAQRAIWTANRWDWTRTTGVFVMSPDLPSYPLFDDFAAADASLVILGANGSKARSTIKEVDLDTFRYQRDNVGDPPSSAPILYAFDSAYLQMWPAPSAAWVSSHPHMELAYIRKVPAALVLGDGASTLQVPDEFTEAVVHYGLWKLKTQMAYPDADKDNAIYRTILREKIQRYRRTEGPSKIRKLRHLSVWG